MEADSSERTRRYQARQSRSSSVTRTATSLFIVGLLTLAPRLAFSQDPVALREGFEPDPYAAEVVAGGPQAGENGECAGHFPAEPSLVVVHAGGETSSLYVYARGDQDLTLLIEVITGGEAGFRCDDDGYSGTDPLLTLTGTGTIMFAVYVGTYAEGATADATLYVSVTDPRRTPS